MAPGVGWPSRYIRDYVLSNRWPPRDTNCCMRLPFVEFSGGCSQGRWPSQHIRRHDLSNRFASTGYQLSYAVAPRWIFEYTFCKTFVSFSRYSLPCFAEQLCFVGCLGLSTGRKIFVRYLVLCFAEPVSFVRKVVTGEERQRSQHNTTLNIVEKMKTTTAALLRRRTTVKRARTSIRGF